jgi:hypothetical protein
MNRAHRRAIAERQNPRPNDRPRQNGRLRSARFSESAGLHSSICNSRSLSSSYSSRTRHWSASSPGGW